MNYEQDYMKRVYESIGKIMAAIAAGIDSIESNIEDDNYSIKLSEDDLLEIMVKKHISNKNFNEAENIIFDQINLRKSKRSYEIALYFYNEINKLDDETLLSANFSREEIAMGLETIENFYKQNVIKSNVN